MTRARIKPKVRTRMFPLTTTNDEKVFARVATHLYPSDLPFCMIVVPLFCTWLLTSLMDEGLPSEMPVGMVDMDTV